MTKTHDWSSDVFGVIQSHRITTIATVPDAGLTRVLKLCNDDPKRRIVTLTSEQEGIGLIVGLWLGGQRGALFMQSSGTGNCINALSLPANAHAPCPMLITMRGDTGEGNPWQVPMGRAAETTLRAMGVTCYLA
ncbi:MAG: phosphonopyruvate decarboxylase, partial [Gammaproteobacteria bacterium]|nr:phosphonopyruvate decarboxylase [Gammaproteobacteria bacterium]